MNSMEWSHTAAIQTSHQTEPKIKSLGKCLKIMHVFLEFKFVFNIIIHIIVFQYYKHDHYYKLE